MQSFSKRSRIRDQLLAALMSVTLGACGGGAGGNTTFYHSVATAKGNVNVTPLTDLVIAKLLALPHPPCGFQDGPLRAQ